ncbi:hypothetical protein P4E94_07400 [Pontiellaceae bacterium B12219]|nr:hypothetical protein [Pontiellaceae bacterium B12219]
MKKSSSSRMPIYLSAFGFPGLGQFVQKRWLAGILFTTTFMIGFIWILILAIRNIIELYSMAFSSDLLYEPTPFPLTAFIEPLLIAFIAYLVSLFDVFLAQQRIATRWHEEEFMEAHKLSD